MLGIMQAMVQVVPKIQKNDTLLVSGFLKCNMIMNKELRLHDLSPGSAL